MDIMEDLSMSPSANDLIITSYGDLKTSNEDESIIQGAVNRIKTIRGELENHPEIGNVALGSRIKYSDSGLQFIRQCCIDAVLQDGRISSVQSMVVEYSEQYNCTINFSVVKYDGTILSSNAIFNAIER